jgi:ABC-type lipoprotein export system ATPase subunit
MAGAQPGEDRTQRAPALRPPPAPRLVLEAKALTRRFGSRRREVRVLNGVDLALFSGQVTALVGPSGSGKTTLLQILAGLLGADSGEALFQGAPLPLMETSRRPGPRQPEGPERHRGG